MSEAAAIVEQTAEIFVSRARPMVPSLFWQIRGPLLRRAHERRGGRSLAASSIVQTHSFRLSERMLRFVIRKSTGHNY